MTREALAKAIARSGQTPDDPETNEFKRFLKCEQQINLCRSINIAVRASARSGPSDIIAAPSAVLPPMF